MADMSTESLQVEWSNRTSTSSGFDRWIVTLTEPETDDKLIVVGSPTPATKTPNAEPFDGDGADVIYDEDLYGMPKHMAVNTASVSLVQARARVFNDGLWEAQVTACYSPPGTAEGAVHVTNNIASASNPLLRAVCVGRANRVAGATETYWHGAPPMPENLAPSMLQSGGVTLTWMGLDADHGLKGYQFRIDDENWGASDSNDYTVIDAEDVTAGMEHTFSVRGQGESDSDRNTDADEIFGMAATVTYMMPMPTPTLTESAAWLLGLMLMGGGMYYTRRRQSGGLTHA